MSSDACSNARPPLPSVFDMDIGSDPDDTYVAAMVLSDLPRYSPVLLLTNDETRDLGRARYLASVAAKAECEVPVAAGRPSNRRRADCLVETAGLCPAGGRFERDGVKVLLDTLDAHPRVRYYGLGALTNLAAALDVRPDLASRLELVQMGPALRGAYRRRRPQYNARLDPIAFATVVGSTTMPTLVMSHSTWGEYTQSNRQRLGVYVDDPLADALRDATPVTALFVRHLETWWAELGRPCSIMHDPLTVLSCLVPGLVHFVDVDLVVDQAGWAALGESSHERLRVAPGLEITEISDYLAAAPVALRGCTSRCNMSIATNAERAREAMATALLGEAGAAVAAEWGHFNATHAH